MHSIVYVGHVGNPVHQVQIPSQVIQLANSYLASLDLYLAGIWKTRNPIQKQCNFSLLLASWKIQPSRLSSLHFSLTKFTVGYRERNLRIPPCSRIMYFIKFSSGDFLKKEEANLQKAFFHNLG